MAKAKKPRHAAMRAHVKFSHPRCVAKLDAACWNADRPRTMNQAPARAPAMLKQSGREDQGSWYHTWLSHPIPPPSGKVTPNLAKR
eukprot:4766965-Amphidinium_carterae.1